MYMLLLLTIVALGIAGMMTWLAWRVVRDERARSEARVAALAAELGGGRERSATPLGTVAPRDGFDVELTRDTADMFSTAARPPRRGARWATAACSGVLVFGLVVAIIVGFSFRAHPHGTAVASTAAAQPLELMALHHERTPDHLVIKGLVRNPAGGTPVNRVSAVVFLFDRDGTFLTSGRALVDFLTLTPGEESPFVVEIPAAGSVRRYRVSFRDAAGGVLPHVDRRSTGVTVG